MRGSVNNREPQRRGGASTPLLGLSGWSFTWNDENRLIVAEGSANVGGASRRRLEFQYDHQGRRRTKKVYTWDDPTQSWILSETHTYLYDQWNVVCERVTDASTQTTTHSIYTWGLDLSGMLQGAGGVGGLLAAHTPDGDWFYAYDGNGNITTLVATSDGTIQAQYDYSPFGLTVSQTGTAANANTYRFSTKPIDQSGLYYYGYRYYSPTLGRWMSRDPIGEKGGEALYGFVQNGTVIRVDIDGRSGWSWLPIIGPFIDLFIHPPGSNSAHYSYEMPRLPCCGDDNIRACQVSIDGQALRYTSRANLPVALSFVVDAFCAFGAAYSGPGAALIGPLCIFDVGLKAAVMIKNDHAISSAAALAKTRICVCR